MDQIRQRAYEIWRSEGCPDGRDRIHWVRAEAEFRERLCAHTRSEPVRQKPRWPAPIATMRSRQQRNAELQPAGRATDAPGEYPATRLIRLQFEDIELPRREVDEQAVVDDIASVAIVDLGSHQIGQTHLLTAKLAERQA